MKKANHLIQSQFGHSQAGMTLIEIMIAVAISSIVVMASISIGNMTSNIQAQNSFSFQADMIRRNIVSLLLSEKAWAKIKSHNPNTNCIGASSAECATGGNLDTIYDATDTLVYDISAGHGFNMDGTTCTSTSPLCMLTFTVTWTPICTANTCIPTQVKIIVKAQYNAPSGAATFGQHNMVFNETNYSTTLYR